jgi:lysophospholipase L1-like esterase
MRIETSLLENTPKVITPFGSGNDVLDTNLARVRSLHTFLEEQGIQMLLVNFPVYDMLVDEYPGGADNFVDYQDRLRAFAHSEQIPYCDLHLALRQEYADASLAAYFQDYYHLNERGAAAVAPLIASFMVQNVESIPSSSPINC